MATDLVSKVLDDHELIRTRFALFDDAAPSEREPLFRQLLELLVQHEAVESIVVHPIVRDNVPDGERIAGERLEEEQAAEERLAELEGMDPATEVFTAAFAQLRDEVLEHAEAEERSTLPLLREHVEAEVLGDDEPSSRAPAADGGQAYEDWTVEQLRGRAGELDLEGRSSMDKGELIAALRRHHG